MRKTVGIANGVPHKALMAALMAGSLLAGCSTLPTRGPTAAQINSAFRNHNDTGFTIVDVDVPTAAKLGFLAQTGGGLAALARPGRVDTLGPGDLLSIGVFEVGVTLFTSAAAPPATGGAFNPSARGTPLENILVDAAGNIQLPYVGRINVTGKTPSEVARMIEGGLRGLSQRPQVLVTVTNNASNVFYVSGDVRTPARLTLALPEERLLDALTRAGGTVSPPDDMVVRVTRDNVSAETRLSAIDASGPQNIALLPGDRVQLINRPRTFLAFGSAERVAQVPFSASELSLAEALARIGGPSEDFADPSAVYLFRYAEPVDGMPKDTPIIYRINMMRPDSYFLSQRIGMRDKDVIYVASAAAKAPGKLAAILGQLFSPFLALRSVAR